MLWHLRLAWESLSKKKEGKQEQSDEGGRDTESKATACEAQVDSLVWGIFEILIHEISKNRNYYAKNGQDLNI